MMLECICCQCSEGPGTFRGWVQCHSCELYGSADEFEDDVNGELCNQCYTAHLENQDERRQGITELRDDEVAPLGQPGYCKVCKRTSVDSECSCGGEVVAVNEDGFSF